MGISVDQRDAKRRAALLVGAVLVLLAAFPGAAAADWRDSDGDGLSHRFERIHAGTHPHERDSDDDGIGDGRENPDRDGLTNRMEQRLHTRPRVRDTDHDGLRDGADDQDCDGISNRRESRAGTDPRKADSDGDGIHDGNEDSDHDGTRDRDEYEHHHDDPSCVPHDHDHDA